MTVSLSGFMGCGKSTIGRALAKALSAEGEEWLFIDLDEAVSKREGMSIPEIFREYGESRFREAECSCLQEILESVEGNIVLALGGGTVMTPVCGDLVREKTVCIYLKASVDTLEANLMHDSAGRPMLNNGEPLRERIEELMEARESVYENESSMTVCIDGLPDEEIIHQIIKNI